MFNNNLAQRNKINTIVESILDTNTYASTKLQHCDKLDFFFYNGQYYELGAESHIEQRIREYFPNVKLTDKEISRIITRIQDLSPVTDSFDSDPNLTNYLNGVYNHKENKLYPHSPRYYFTHQVNQNYVENAPSSLSKLAARLAMIG